MKGKKIVPQSGTCYLSIMYIYDGLRSLFIFFFLFVYMVRVYRRIEGKVKFEIVIRYRKIVHIIITFILNEFFQRNASRKCIEDMAKNNSIRILIFLLKYQFLSNI